jgi:hypothetical protein
VKLATVRKHAMSLDAVTEEPHHNHSSFRVRGSIFVTIPPGEEVIHVFVDEEHREPALAMHPEFLQKLLWGGKVQGLRVHLAAAEPNLVKSLISQAYEARVRRDAGPRRSAARSNKAKT